MWHSFILHTMYLTSLFILAAHNGASWYFRAFPRRLAKMKEEDDEPQLQATQEECGDCDEGATCLVDSNDATLDNVT